MRITSTDANSWFEVEQHGDEDYRSFVVRASVNLGHGRFSGENIDVHFSLLRQFTADLDRFILDRQLRPSLAGTYGSSLTFWKGKTLNDVLFSFVIGDAFCGYSVTSEYKIEGTFQLDQETLHSLVVFFKGCHADA